MKKGAQENDGETARVLQDHPQRYALANELHARPATALKAPCQAAYLALKLPNNAAGRSREADRAHLIALLDRFGAAHPRPGANHYFADLGHFRLKWEQHTEFVTYTLFSDGLGAHPFDASLLDALPAQWLADAPGDRLSAALFRVEPMPKGGEAEMNRRLAQWFVSESLAASYVADRHIVAAGDFRIDPAGFMRFALFVDERASERRIGRAVQRLCDIEVYKTMALLALPRARKASKRLVELDADVSALVQHLQGNGRPDDEVLDELLALSSELEAMMAQNTYRFSASSAYAAIMQERIEVLREERFHGRQCFREFMLRRFDPAQRSIRATVDQLEKMALRTKRAGDLLRTRVEVERSAQNQQLLASMDRRADLQLRLQKTVEGLSVVAIGYYAVNLCAYFLLPFAKKAGIEKLWLMAGLTPAVVLIMWWLMNRVRKHLE